MLSEPSSTERCADPDAPPAATLETVLDAYLDELAAGGQPDQQAYLRAHPELADALRGVFKTLDFVEATSKTLRAGPLERGARLGEFRIVREVARGGMGVVYEAVQTSLGRRVALKVLPAGALLSPTAAERFTREASTAGKLHHSNIVPVYAIGEEDGISYYAMQFIEGRSLAEHLKALRRAGAAPQKSYYRQVARWGQQIAEALDYAHRQGIIHRDVKPSNLLLDERDNVWVTDFGLARADALASLTVTGDVVGTARYMSPEQARGGRERLDARTDVYSMGASLYEMLALAPAFDGASREDVLNRIAFSEPRPLRQLNAHTPRDLETVVCKCMRRNIPERYASAADAAEDFRRFLAGDPVRARRTPPHVRLARFVGKHRVHTLGSLLALTLFVLAFGSYVKMRHHQGAQLLDEALTAILFERDDRHAAELLDDAKRMGAESPTWHLYRGLIPLLDNQPHRARPHLDEALRRDPNFAEAGLAQALALAGEGDFFNSQRALDRYNAFDPPSALACYLRGLTESKSTGGAAIEWYNRAIVLRPDFTPAIDARAYYRGVRLITEGDRAQLDPMLNDLDALVVFRSMSANSYTARARGWLFAAAHAGAGDDLRAHETEWLGKCREDLAAAMNLRRENDSLTWLRRGLYERYRGDFASAAQAFGEAISVDRAAGRDPHPYRMHEYTVMLYALGDFKTARKHVAHAAAQAPNYCPLAVQHALLLAELGQPDEARAVCRDSLQQQRGNISGLCLSAAFWTLMGDSEAAEDAVAEYLATYDGNQNVEGASAPLPTLAFLAGRIDADTFLARTNAVPGGWCEAHFIIGLRELGCGRREAGLLALEQAVDTGVFIFSEYRFAQALLARATADPSWPSWTSQNRAESVRSGESD